MAGAANQARWILPGTWSHLWFAGVRECPPGCSIVGATVTVHQFFCILHFCHNCSLCRVELVIFTMVSYFLHWTLLKFFNSFPDEQSQQKVRQLDRITCAVINTSNEVKSLLLWEFWIYNFSLRILERVVGWKHCKYKEWVSFFSGLMGNES